MTDSTLAGLCVLAILLWFAASIVYRRRMGRQIFAAPMPDAVFVERWASGRCGSGLMARLSTARNCLQVQVTPTELRLTPHFPFTLGFLPEIYGYDQRVALADIRSVQILGGHRAKAVEIQYGDKAKGLEVIQLLLHRGEDFVAHIRPTDSAA